MEIFQKFGLFGVVLFALTVSIPLMLIASKGFKKDTYRGEKKEKSIIGTVFFIILSLLVLPSILFLAYNFTTLVILKKMPMSEFITNIRSLSFQPIILFYTNVVHSIRTFISDLLLTK